MGSLVPPSDLSRRWRESAAPVTRPDGMTAETWARIGKLRADVRDRVLERAAILIYEAGLDPATADERALAEEAGVGAQKALVA